MSFNNYTDLRSAIISWSNRSDGGLFIDDFILLAELYMFNNEDESLRLRLSESRVIETLSTSSRFISLPAGYRSMRSIRINQTDIFSEIEFRTTEQMRRRDGIGQPCFFAVTSNIEFDVTPDLAYGVEINYFKEPAAITSTNATNEVLAKNPNVYLHGSLFHLFVKAGDQDNALMYKGLLDSAIAGANKASQDGRYGPSMVSIPDTFTP